jgi:hypothetical protein
VKLPQTFIRYVSERARSLLTTDQLELYVSAVEAGLSTDPSLLEASGALARLRREIDNLPNVVSVELYAQIGREFERSREPGPADVGGGFGKNSRDAPGVQLY